MLRGSSTNVGKVTLDKSIPTLGEPSVRSREHLAGNIDHIPELRYQGENNRPLIFVSIGRVSVLNDHGSIKEYRRKR